MSQNIRLRSHQVVREINGDQALVYSRMRYQDPEGDYGRQKRQREVIKRLLRKF